MNVWLSGPTASGKTTLARTLSELGFGIVREKLPSEAFRAFARDPASNCKELQEAILRSRHSQWSQVVDPLVAFDRSIDEDIHVFCEMHHRLGYLTLDELNELRALGDELQAAIPPPDLILYMRPLDNVIRERLERDGQPQLITENIDLQLRLYSEWLATRSESIIRVDNSACQLGVLERLISGGSRC